MTRLRLPGCFNFLPIWPLSSLVVRQHWFPPVLVSTSSLSKTLTFTTWDSSSKNSVLSLLLFHCVNTPLLVLRLFPDTAAYRADPSDPALLLCSSAAVPCCRPKGSDHIAPAVSGWSTNQLWDTACHIPSGLLIQHSPRLQSSSPKVKRSKLTLNPALTIAVVLFKWDRFFDPRKKQLRWKKMDIS